MYKYVKNSLGGTTVYQPRYGADVCQYFNTVIMALKCENVAMVAPQCMNITLAPQRLNNGVVISQRVNSVYLVA